MTTFGIFFPTYLPTTMPIEETTIMEDTVAKKMGRIGAAHGEGHGHKLGLVAELVDEEGEGDGSHRPEFRFLYLFFLFFVINGKGGEAEKQK